MHQNFSRSVYVGLWISFTALKILQTNSKTFKHTVDQLEWSRNVYLRVFVFCVSFSICLDLFAKLKAH